MDPIMFPINASLKLAADEKAAELGISRAALYRQAIATYIGQPELAGEKTERPKKYSSPEERKAAQKLRQKTKTEQLKELMEAARKAERAGDIAALQEYLDKKLSK